MSFNIGHALLAAAQGFLMGGPVGTVAPGVGGGFDSPHPSTADAAGIASPEGNATALLGRGATGSLVPIFALDSIEKTFERTSFATPDTAFKLFA